VSKLFDKIDQPDKLKLLPAKDLTAYADWLRQYLISHIAEHGGHFAANLGVIELTVALHYVFNAPSDIMVWDVGHQAYAHKLLTGRKNDFSSLRKLDGLSGFPKMSESDFDAFGTAHSSTSISAVLGYASAAKILQIERQHIAIIGDGALSAGQAFEALNNAGISRTNTTIIINDNHIGIDPSQGALGEYLEQLEFKPDNLFTDFGFQYFGPIDGHNIPELLAIFNTVKTIDAPKIIHVRTMKGKGYGPAEAEQTKWHSTSQFDKLSGKSTSAEDTRARYQDIFGQTLLELAEKDKNIVAVTPAMISGSSLHWMQEKFPERVFDVGIAEQHAVTFSAGLAASGLTPFCCIYSTFLQRAYDQLIHDVALQNLPVIFAIDRAGLVGEDGPTHHGVFDIAFLQTIPNLTILSPRNQQELRDAVYTAALHKTGPIVLRYPRGKAAEAFETSILRQLPPASGECLKEGSHTAVISVGTMADICATAVHDTSAAHYDLRYIKPMDTKMLKHIFSTFDYIVVVEEGQKLGGVGSSISLLATEHDYKGNIKCLGLDDHFVSHGSMKELYEKEGLTVAQIRAHIHKI
jgi:1-deoxy-D-xylulose-5-phosphate synthase